MTTAPRPLVRAVIPAALVLIWLLWTAWGGQTFGNLSSVTSSDQATFLPAEAESTRASELQQQFSEDDAVPATIIATAAGADAPELSQEQIGAAEALAEEVGELEGVVQLLPVQPSEDGRAVQITALLDEEAADAGLLGQLRSLTAEELPESDWNAYVTGPAALSADLSEAFAGIDGLLLLVAVAAVLIILVVVYRSVLLPLLVLLSSVGALCAAITVIFLMAQAGWIQLNEQVQGILSILVIGAATDYSLLLVARYREELASRENRITALAVAVRRSAPAILASGGTVAVALLCLLFSDLNSNRALGPVASAGIVFAMLATLTFLPALLVLTGRPAFWPQVPQAADAADPGSRKAQHRLWQRVAAAVRSRPRTVWIAVTLLLLLGAAGVPQLKAEGIPQSEFVLGETGTKSGQALLEEHFDAGTGSPASVFVSAEEAEPALELVTDAEGVGAAFLIGEGGAPAEGPQEAAEVDDWVQISATLTSPGDSQAAEETVRQLRMELDSLSGPTLVGGTSATQLDTNETAQRDLRVIIPAVLVAITVILVLLLRSLVAPLLLVGTTVLSFLTALGISAVVFNHIFGFPGADPTVPLYGFMFLVALGVDYNIFLMTRAREETPGLGAAEGTLRSLVVTGGVITSAGIVLAATFSALAVLPIMFMVQLAFLVALGVLIDTFVVRTLQVPALCADIGQKIWWPSKLSGPQARASASASRSRSASSSVV
ncbi:MMPL family transporter [Nesterenkonia alkaliphila]|uniref:MMPL family transporter n=1 Tax=Nesterenkonia alkaliphila TaxID=1463631 RepID=A0A7K1UGR0_9MICC|nr:MMPL family transporter [Nesterenkonia alkaliphila]MVT25655.1 MMPL family transporter [Nesterenkonia alkaliphila]GFZ84918.1 membrane protein [Nesterenkonia alkaliphila]